MRFKQLQIQTGDIRSHLRLELEDPGIDVTHPFADDGLGPPFRQRLADERLTEGVTMPLNDMHEAMPILRLCHRRLVENGVSHENGVRSLSVDRPSITHLPKESTCFVLSCGPHAWP